MDSPDASQLYESLQELVAQRSHNPDDTFIRSASLFAQLKAANRAANTAARNQKGATALARQEMDQSHLGLQNLLYERRHLEREIEKCRQFASVYQDIPLYSLEEYRSLAPPEATTDEILADEHQLMVQRLSFELVERQRLDAKKRELMQQKEDLIKQSKSKLTTQDSVNAQIDILMKVATDVQKKVDELVTSIPPENSAVATT